MGPVPRHPCGVTAGRPSPPGGPCRPRRRRVHRTSLIGWRVELPGVEPGSRGPEARGSTCVGPGSSRTRCSRARQPPCPYRLMVFPGRSTVGVPGWSLVMSITTLLRGIGGGSSRVFRPRGPGCCPWRLWFPACFVEVTRAPSARSPGNGLTTVETVSAPGVSWCASTLCSCQPAGWVRTPHRPDLRAYRVQPTLAPGCSQMVTIRRRPSERPVTDQRPCRRCFIARSISRLASRLARSWRLSATFLPRPIANSSLARPSRK
jgi:hypothetical protein